MVWYTINILTLQWSCNAGCKTYTIFWTMTPSSLSILTQKVVFMVFVPVLRSSTHLWRIMLSFGAYCIIKSCTVLSFRHFYSNWLFCVSLSVSHPHNIAGYSPVHMQTGMPRLGSHHQLCTHTHTHTHTQWLHTSQYMYVVYTKLRALVACFTKYCSHLLHVTKPVLALD